MKFAIGKYGFKSDPVGAQVALPWNGRTLLGDVVGAERDFVTGNLMLSVRHFNGEPWPIKPVALAVDVLERR